MNRETWVSPQPLVGIVAMVAGLLTVVVSFSDLRLAYRNPLLHLSLETAEAVIAYVVAFLFFGRFRQTGRLGDLVLVYVLLVLGSINLFLSVAPATMFEERGEMLTPWVPASLRVLAPALLVASALGLDRSVRFKEQGGLAVFVASLVTIVLALVLGWVLQPLLPDPIGVVISSAASERPQVTGHPVFLGLQLVGMALYGVAAAAFVRRANRGRDELMSWVGAACVLSGLARLNYFLFPSLYTDYVYTGDLLRLGSYALFLVGGAREVGSYWRGLARAAVAEERAMVAGQLHDGVAQELVFISAQARRLLKKGADETQLRRLASAADRAVAESRRAISMLSRAHDQGLDEALIEMADDIRHASGLEIQLSLAHVSVPVQVREAMLRIAREAIANAATHSRCNTLRLELTGGDVVRMSIHDDGVGFDTEAQARNPHGFGLLSMSERARALGGSLDLRSAPGQGTAVAVTLARADGIDSQA